MRASFLTFLLLIVLASGCSSAEEPALPDDIYAPKEFAAPMGDILVAEAWVTRTKAKADSAQGLLAAEYAVIIGRYKLDKQRFYKSLEWYLRQPREMELLLAYTIDTLQSKKAYSEVQDKPSVLPSKPFILK